MKKEKENFFKMGRWKKRETLNGEKISKIKNRKKKKCQRSRKKERKKEKEKSKGKRK